MIVPAKPPSLLALLKGALNVYEMNIKTDNNVISKMVDLTMLNYAISLHGRISQMQHVLFCIFLWLIWCIYYVTQSLPVRRLHCTSTIEASSVLLNFKLTRRLSRDLDTLLFILSYFYHFF